MRLVYSWPEQGAASPEQPSHQAPAHPHLAGAADATAVRTFGTLGNFVFSG